MILFEFSKKNHIANVYLSKRIFLLVAMIQKFYLLESICVLTGLLFPCHVLAHDVTINGIYYNLNYEDKTAAVTCASETKTYYVGGTQYSYLTYPDLQYEGDILIPSTISVNDIQYTVTSISADAFSRGNSPKLVSSVSLPHTIKSIGESAFLNCTIINQIEIPDSVEEIQGSAFKGCTALKYVKLGKFLNSLGGSCFQDCTSLKSLTISDSTKTIGQGAFFRCSALEYLYLGNALTSLGKSALLDCKNLRTLVLNSKTIKREWISEWYYNYHLSGRGREVPPVKTLTIGPNVEIVDEASFEISDLGTHILPYLSNLDTLNLNCPIVGKWINGVGSCGELRINVGKTVKKFVHRGEGSELFPSPKRVLNIEDLESWCKIVFSGPPESTSPSFFCDTILIENKKVDSLVISDPSLVCNEYSFVNFGMKYLYLPEGLKSLPYQAFRECKNLKDIHFPNSLEEIANSAFYGCTGLSSITIGSGINSIKESAFINCKALTSVIMKKESPIKITSNTFYNQQKATLYVPRGSKSNYKSADVWKDFKEIVELSEANIPIRNLIYLIDGVEYKIFELEEGASIIPEPAPEREGYTFSGWSEIPETMPANNVTVTGTFTINKYKLTYMVDDTEYKTDSIEYKAKINPEAVPTKEGYTFSGWSEIPETMPANDVTVTGTFSINKYKLTYMVDGAEYKSYDVEYGASITPEETPTKEGYTFSGWSEIPETMPAKDVTVTGTFSINKYKLTYMVDGAEYKSYDVEYGVAITPEEAPTKEGYTFSGWSEIPETMPANDVTVTGTFSVNKYKLTYMVDGAEYKSYDVDYGAAITPEPAPIKEGYTFSGWSDIPEKMPANDLTVTGTFSINKYKLTYLVDGVEYKSYDVEYGAAITPEPTPTKEGYTFSGWSDIPSTMPANDVVVTGSFSAIVIKEDKGEFTATSGSTAELSNDNNVSGEYEIPETVTYDGVTYTVTSIGNEAFKDNISLTDVTIPSTTTSIGESAFAGCSNLKSITVNTTTPIAFPSASRTRGGSTIFEGVDKNTCILYVPEGCVEAYKVAPVWGEFANILVIGTSSISGVLFDSGKQLDIYSLDGRKVKSNATSAEGLPKGVYIINGKKVLK